MEFVFEEITCEQFHEWSTHELNKYYHTAAVNAVAEIALNDNFIAAAKWLDHAKTCRWIVNRRFLVVDQNHEKAFNIVRNEYNNVVRQNRTKNRQFRFVSGYLVAEAARKGYAVPHKYL